MKKTFLGIRTEIMVLAAGIVLGLLLSWCLHRNASEPELSEGVDTICETVGYTAYQGEHDAYFLSEGDKITVHFRLLCNTFLFFKISA